MSLTNPKSVTKRSLSPTTTEVSVVINGLGGIGLRLVDFSFNCRKKIFYNIAQVARYGQPEELSGNLN
jgi:hypothetical protein